MAYANSTNVNVTGIVTLSSAGVATGSTVTNHGVVTAGANNTVTSVAPSTSGNVLTSNGTDWVSSAAITQSSAFSYYLHNSVSNITGDGTEYVLTGLTSSYDPGSVFNGQTFTAPATGVYMIGVQFYISDLTATFTYLQGRVNHSAGFGLISTMQPVWQAGATFCLSMNGLVSMNASETITFSIIGAGSTKTLDLTGDVLSDFATYVYGYRIA